MRDPRIHPGIKRLWSWRFPSGLDGIAAAGIAVLMALHVYAPWPMDLRMPFWFGGDATSAQYILKSILEHGTYTHNPDVGAPFGATMYDYPIPEPTHQLLIRFIGLFTTNPFLAFNLFYLISFATAAFTACWVFKRNTIGRLPAIAGAIAFSLLPYHFLRIGHVFLASYFAIPLIAHYALQLARGGAPQQQLRASVWWKSALVLAIAAGGGVYYAFFGVLFIALGTAMGASLYDSRATLRAGTVYIAVIISVIAISLLPNALYHLSQGSNLLIAHRSPMQSEVYGLRITQLLFPTPGHRLNAFAHFLAEYAKATPLVNENMTAALGTLGSVGFLLALAAFFSRDVRKYPLLSATGAFCVAGVLYATIGGFGAIVAWLVTPEIRGLNRISVFIAFFALFALLVAAQRMIGLRRYRWANMGFALFVVTIAWLDQVPTHAIGKLDVHAFSLQQAFFNRVQAKLPLGSALFELPYDYFPESPKPPSSYYLLDPYLFTTGFRWSFGDMHGRPSDFWNEQVSSLSGKVFADALGTAGFTEIYVDGKGYADHGAAIEKELAAQFGAPIIADATLGRAIYRVPTAQPNTPPFIAAEIGRGWFAWESEPQSKLEGAWSKGSADIILANPAAETVSFVIRFRLSTLVARKVTLTYQGHTVSEAQLMPGNPLAINLSLGATPGISRLSLATDVSAQRPGNGDPRRLAFHIEDLEYGAFDANAGEPGRSPEAGAGTP